MADSKPGILLFAKGMAMGAADVVPGVSGGTVAFITGIYDQLITSIRAVDLGFARDVLAGRWAQAWQRVQGGFLLCLLAGIATSILSLAQLISYLLEHARVPLMAFFVGLIAASLVPVWRDIRQPGITSGLWVLLGVAAMTALGMTGGANWPAEPLWIVAAGALAICAMILPGISGSFILLLLGLYEPVLQAIKSFDLMLIALFGGGCIVGLLSFVRLLSWLLEHYRDHLLALLSGVLAGSLQLLWPWRLQASGLPPVDKHDVTQPVWPQAYAANDLDPQLGLSVLVALLGLTLVLWLTVATRNHEGG